MVDECSWWLERNAVPDAWIEPLSLWIANQPSDILIPLARSIQSAVFHEQTSQVVAKALRHRALQMRDHPDVAIKLISCSPSTTDLMDDSISVHVIDQLTNATSSIAQDADEALARISLSKSMQQRLWISLIRFLRFI